jgi:RNA polymerase sigma-70 factor, ECF subfamily
VAIQLSRRSRVLVEEEDDQALLAGIRRGDRAAFKALVERYQGPLYNAAFRIVGNGGDAEDVTQVVFLKIVERLDEYDPRYKFFSWIYRIAVNEALNLLRRDRRDEPLDDDLEVEGPETLNPERQLSDMQVSSHVQNALMCLKPDDRAVLTLRHFSECSYAEIGDILGLEEKTVKSRLFEARGRLKGHLAAWRGN